MLAVVCDEFTNVVRSAFAVSDAIHVDGEVAETCLAEYEIGHVYHERVRDALLCIQNFKSELEKLAVSSALWLVVTEERAIVIEHHGLDFRVHATFNIGAHDPGGTFWAYRKRGAAFGLERIEFFFYNICSFAYTGCEKSLFFKNGSVNRFETIIDRNLGGFFKKSLKRIKGITGDVAHSLGAGVEFSFFRFLFLYHTHATFIVWSRSAVNILLYSE